MRLVVVAFVVVACKGSDPGKQAPPGRVRADAGVKPKPKAKPTPQPASSPLPEVGPHPDYPTPVAAGTDKIFMLEEPDRGPQAPLDFALPDAGALAWTVDAFCEATPTTVVCSGAKADPKARRSWRIGRKANKLLVVEAHRGDLVDETYVYVMGPGGDATQRIRFDEHGRVEEALLFQTPTRYSARKRNGGNALAGCGSMDLETDKNHRVTRTRCLQWVGEPMLDVHGVALTRYVRDAHGFVTDELRFGLDGKPSIGIDGVHHLHFERDALGRPTAERYLGIDDKPGASAKGCHGKRFERDAAGQLVRTTCVGTDDKPSNDVAGASTEERTYNLHGCQISQRSRGVAGNQITAAEYVVDDRCAHTSYTCVTSKGDRESCGIGSPARYDYKRDAAGNTISTAYYGVDGAPVKDLAYGTFELRYEYDALDNVISHACFDSTGHPMQCDSLGYHREKKQVDAAGREIARTFFDERGGSAKNVGAYTRKFQYDNYDHIFESSGLDSDGKLVEGLGMATRRDLYDTSQRSFAVVLLDRAGKPARYTGCYGGSTCPKSWHAVRIVRRADGEVETNQFFDAAGQLIQTADCKKTRCFK